MQTKSPQQEQSAPRKKELPFALKTFDKEMVIASYFGFTPVRTPEIKHEDVLKAKAAKDPYWEKKKILDSAPFAYDVVEKCAMLRTFSEWGMEHLAHPILISYKKPYGGCEWKSNGDYVLGLEVFGISGSSAEGTLLRTILSILTEEGYKNLNVRINSIGDKDSVADYERMLQTYARKNMNAFPAELRKVVKTDIYDLIRIQDEKSTPFQTNAPKSMSFLSENSRIHFKEIVEYVESLSTPYDIIPTLIGSPSFCSHALFEVESEGKVLAHAYRYSRLSKKIGWKRELPCIGATLAFKKKSKDAPVKSIPNPKIYLVQLGFAAKLKSLAVLEVLRKARITVAHSISKDKLQNQLGSAENMKLAYVIIIGQKEAYENSVVVRNMDTRVQETVPIIELAEYIKNLAF